MRIVIDANGNLTEGNPLHGWLETKTAPASPDGPLPTTSTSDTLHCPDCVGRIDHRIGQLRIHECDGVDETGVRRTLRVGVDSRVDSRFVTATVSGAALALPQVRNVLAARGFEWIQLTRADITGAEIEALRTDLTNIGVDVIYDERRSVCVSSTTR